MAESRTELLNWLNSTLDLNHTKVEQLGTGAAYVQIMDSIFLDLPMNRIKFDAAKEYQYMQNFKVLQSCFLKHNINKSIPVERLVKCRFQDNLEFLQWMRKYWKENKDESDYDANARRKNAPPASSAPTPRATRVDATTTRRSASGSSTASNTLPRTRPASITTSRTASTTSKPASRVSSMNHSSRELETELQETKASLGQAEEEIIEYKQALDALESERNFYFNKLREIEILTETNSTVLKDDGAEHPTLKDVLIKIQEVLYSTEEGFLIPEEGEVPDIDMEGETF